MNEITEDRWDEEIWGSAESNIASPRPKLIFYFGEKDHWVADHTRDQLIAARASNGAESWKPKMYIDQSGIPHSFCIRKSSMSLREGVSSLWKDHSSAAAEKVRSLILEIVQDQAVESIQARP